MIRLESRSWRSELQRRLDRETVARASMQVGGGEETLQVRPQDHATGLAFGPYGTSPLKGLHFESVDDTATS